MLVTVQDKLGDQDTLVIMRQDLEEKLLGGHGTLILITLVVIWLGFACFKLTGWLKPLRHIVT
jgi:hypothetical protein